MLIFISNYKYFSDSFQQFFSFQKEDTIEEAFEETILDELSHLRKDFELIDRKIQDLDKDVNDRLSQVEQKVGDVSSQENFESIKNINSELLDIKDRLNRINLDSDNGNTLIFAIGQLVLGLESYHQLLPTGLLLAVLLLVFLLVQSLHSAQINVILFVQPIAI